MKMLINIDVPDVASALAFYQAALGLTLSRMLGDDVAELSGASSTLYLVQKPACTSSDPSATTVRQYARHWTPVHIDFVVTDIEQAAERAVLAGAKRETKCIDWRGAKCVTFSDPFGHGFCLLEFEGGGYHV
jgi:predicted enzyme related to lactoylglutathione lyase